MQFTLATLLGLSATTLAAVLPRSSLGSWDVSVFKASYANGLRSLDVTAIYSSDTINATTSTCRYEYNPGADPKESTTCDNDAFSYEYTDDVISLKQTVQLDELTTVSGSAPLTLTSTGTGRSSEGTVVVEATNAIA